MEIQKNISLKPYHTFGIEVYANEFVVVNTISELKEALQYIASKKTPYLTLGGGSNILFISDYQGVILQINLQGKELIQQNETEVFIKVQAGEPWHSFVLWTLEHGFSGLENLSLIPGNVGSSPIQNIGAYGVEVKDVIEKVEVLNTQTLDVRYIDKKDCQFGYRDSIFKRQQGKYIITAVIFKLSRQFKAVNTTYGAIQTFLSNRNISEPTSKDVSDAVIDIRRSKLPDPQVLGNSGSFFKNPVVSLSLFKQIQEKYPQVPHYPAAQNTVKLAAGWLIEQAGFKGIKIGEVGVHDQQALVLVNYGHAKGHEVLALAKAIQEKVQSLFGVVLEMEVNVV